MSDKPDGGFAFPVPMGTNGWNGMTLRDYFAAQIVNGMAANPELLRAIQARKEAPETVMAGMAFALADAMLEQRKV